MTYRSKKPTGRILTGMFVTKDRTKEVLSGLATLAQRQVLVGFPAEKTARNDGLSNAELGYIHNFGEPVLNIPQREFMASGLLMYKDRITMLLRQAGDAAVTGKPSRVDQLLHAAGLAGMTGIKKKIVAGPFQELSPRTIAARQARGVSRTKPLIDTAQMLNAVSYVIRWKATPWGRMVGKR